MSRLLIVMGRGAALLLLVAATIYALNRWALIPLRCSYTASIGAATLDLAEQSGHKSARLAREIRDDLKGCDCVSPHDVAIPMTLAATAEACNDLPTAITEYQHALQIDRRPEIYFHLGLIQYETLDHRAAIENIIRACAFDPARLADIPYDDARQETKRRLEEAYGAEWVW